jgi:hypothetical protein
MVLLPVLLVVVGCSTKPKMAKTDPYQISEKEFKKTVKIVAAASVEIPEGLPDPKPLQQEFDSLITTELRRYGYTVVRPEEYTAVWNRLAVEMGGFEDPDSGGLDEKRMIAAMSRTIEELKAPFDLDAFLFAKITVVEAQFAAGTAVWDGADQKIETAGPMTSFLSGSQRGVVDALSLVIDIRGADGAALYAGAGGIEVLTKVSGKEFVQVPRQELFTDKARNAGAAKIALKKLKR